MKLQQRTINNLELTPCIYCGEVANSVDHFVPRAFRRIIENWRLLGFESYGVVPSCMECNCTAGSNVFITIVDKRNFIKDFYRRKYRRLIDAIPWTDEELEELGYALRSTVRTSEAERYRLILRLAWPYETEIDVFAADEYRKLMSYNEEDTEENHSDPEPIDKISTPVMVKMKLSNIMTKEQYNALLGKT